MGLVSSARPVAGEVAGVVDAGAARRAAIVVHGRKARQRVGRTGAGLSQNLLACHLKLLNILSCKI